MTRLFQLLAELPPPPEPSSVEADDTGQIIGVIVLVLMAAYVLAFILRSTVLRPARRRAPYGYTDAEMDPGTVGSETTVLPALNRPGGRTTAAAERDPVIQRRLQQFTAPDGIERRRLDNRRPGSTAEELHEEAPRVAVACRARWSASASSLTPDITDESDAIAPAGDVATPACDPLEREDTKEDVGDTDTSEPLDTAASSGDGLAPDEVAALSSQESDQPSDTDLPLQLVGDEPLESKPDAPSIEERGGEPPSAADVDLMAATTVRQGRGKVIPFPVRAPRVETPAPDGGPVSPPDAIAITATIQKLLDCANTGRVMEGFRLYTDAHLMRFITSSNMTPIEFREAAAAVEPKPEAEWTRLMEVTNVEWQLDGRVNATVHYQDGDQPDGRERYTLIRAAGGGWLIDDISRA